jgi:hypothetical protein
MKEVGRYFKGEGQNPDARRERDMYLLFKMASTLYQPFKRITILECIY